MAHGQHKPDAGPSFHSRRFEGRTVLVTGGTCGIGLAIAERLVREGASVVVCSRQEANVRAALAHLRACRVSDVQQVQGRRCHVAQRDQRRALVDHCVRTLGPIDVLVNNVGVNMAVGHILDVSRDQLDKLLDVNVKANFEVCRLVVPHMSRGGAILFTSSLAAYRVPGSFNTYGAVKAALASLTIAMSMELAERGIRVNSIVPGTVNGTKMGRLLWDPSHRLHRLVHAAAEGSKGVMNRFAETDEVAGAAAYLCSTDASFVTGENHLITGGVDARL